jgi:peptidoglycan/xylan/chitin deacetylase (PgdA/CDA1 family)
MLRSAISLAFILVLTIVSTRPALAQTASAPACDNPGALGTSRVLEVHAATTPRVGLKQFPQTLPLAPKELVLTFDDGPWPQTTPKVLDALNRECVRSTFFLLGRNTAAAPALARRLLAEGHTVGHHTYTHRILSHVSEAVGEREINRGFATDDDAVYGRHDSEPRVPFFRFPGFASTPALLDDLQRRGIVVFGADVWASDWNPMEAPVELALVLKRIEKVGRGIVLLHDTRAQTVKMLPAFLRALKERGFRIVHIVPAGGRS